MRLSHLLMFVALVLLASRVKLEHITDPLKRADAAPADSPVEFAAPDTEPDASPAEKASAPANDRSTVSRDDGFHIAIVDNSLVAHIAGAKQVLLHAVGPERSHADILRAHDLAIPGDPAATIRAAFIVEQSRNYFAVCVRWARSEGFSFAATDGGWAPELFVSSQGTYVTVMHESAYLDHQAPAAPSSFQTGALTWYPTLAEAIAHPCYR